MSEQATGEWSALLDKARFENEKLKEVILDLKERQSQLETDYQYDEALIFELENLNRELVEQLSQTRTALQIRIEQLWREYQEAEHQAMSLKPDTLANHVSWELYRNALQLLPSFPVWLQNKTLLAQPAAETE